jgi:hypothetical protein
MTEQEQWQEINYPSFFGAIGDKIEAAIAAMTAVPAAVVNEEGYAPWLGTNVNNVPIHWRIIDTDHCEIKVGVKDDGSPIEHFTIPTQWLAA